MSSAFVPPFIEVGDVIRQVRFQYLYHEFFFMFIEYNFLVIPTLYNHVLYERVYTQDLNLNDKISITL